MPPPRFTQPGNLLANQWFFSAPVRINQDAPSGLSIDVTDPNNMWFTTAGFIKEFGIQVQGYDGQQGWDNVDPWLGWGWWVYTPGGNPKQNLIDPSQWIAFGTPGKGGVPGLGVVLSSPIPAGSSVRVAAQSDTDITLGLEIIFP